MNFGYFEGNANIISPMSWMWRDKWGEINGVGRDKWGGVGKERVRKDPRMKVELPFTKLGETIGETCLELKIRNSILEV